MHESVNTRFVNSVLAPLLHTAQFYASIVGGWWLFHNGIYPLAYFAKGSGASLAAQLPIYAMNVLAFGCMAYVITRPFMLLLIELLHAAEQAINKLCSRR